MFHGSYVLGMSRFTSSPPEYDAAMYEGISPADEGQLDKCPR
jgi:hypothetical protein